MFRWPVFLLNTRVAHAMQVNSTSKKLASVCVCVFLIFLIFNFVVLMLDIKDTQCSNHLGL